MFISHNTEGLRVLDVADPTLPVEVGYYDTWGGESGGFNGLWSACPYFPSGKIIGGNRTDGLYVWTFNDTRAARIYGTVTDAQTGEIIPRANFTVSSNGQTFRSDLTGNYKEGFLAGTYTFEIKKDGYETETIEVALAEGDSLVRDIELMPLVNNAADSSEYSDLIQLQNPFYNQLTINILQPNVAQQIRLINSVGQLINQQKVTGNQVEMTTSTLPQGAYFLQVFNENNELIYREQLIKN